MRPRRFSSRGNAAQAARRDAWAAYTADRRWRARRRAWLDSPAANAICPGCGRVVGERDDVHHLRYPDIPGTEADHDLLLLCRPCHESVHASLDSWPSWRRIDRRPATWAVLTALYRNRVKDAHCKGANAGE